MLEQAMQVHKTLLLMGETLIFSYNIETTQLQEEGFASAVSERIQQAGISPNLVTLEVTETKLWICR
ncbi:EAL domain-containing protein [Pseudomonas hygromyciniae]|uniref:EAL domain-containing protein n=1 Tax=Pseudomonas hygromyciniae TaxID=2812000 RepID=A0ABX7JY54_9PSED|nr:EAL domain-containing protein [Pseudomonas hygromyciniae]QSB39168.1 EAL domain-containing protein [Pseudomonas hygromyciniae]